MPKSRRQRLAPDVSQTAEALVRAITGTERVNGEDLIGSPELKRQLREAKAKDAAARSGKR